MSLPFEAFSACFLSAHIQPPLSLPRSEAIMDAIPHTRYLPSSVEIIAQLKELAKNAVPPALAVMDPLVPQNTEGPARARKAETDVFGLSSSARLAAVALAALSADRTLLKKDPSWLYFLSTFSILAADELALPGSADHIFAASVAPADLERFVQVADGLRSYALTTLASTLDLGWHQSTIAAIQKTATPADGLASVLAALVKDVQGAGAVYPSRVLRDLLAGVLHTTGAGSAEAEKWVAYGRTMQDKGRSFDACPSGNQRPLADATFIARQPLQPLSLPFLSSWAPRTSV